MSLIPNTTCRRCHRQYPSFRSRCPYCGTKKVREVRSAVPESDSAVPGTQASRNAAESLNLQMLMGGGLLLAVIVLAIILVSARVGADASVRQSAEEIINNVTANTPIPPPTGVPTPSPSPTPQIQKIECRWGTTGVYDYVELGGFSMPEGSSIPLSVIWFPATIPAIPEWSVDDEDIVSISPSDSGLECTAKMVGEKGESTVLHLTVNGIENDMKIRIT